MNFSYGIIITVGVLAAVSVGFIAMSPDEVIGSRVIETDSVPPMYDSGTSSVSIPLGTGLPGCEDTNECYLPFTARVTVGTTVTWFNEDNLVHTVTSGTGPISDGMFDSGLISVNETFEFTFDDLGSFEYYCIVHPWMIGNVQVV